MSGPKLALGEVLLESGSISPADLETAERHQQSSGRALREIIAELGVVNEVDLQRAIARVEGVEFLDLNSWAIDPSAASLLPESLARRYRILAIGFRGDRPVIAMVNPTDVFALDDVRTMLGRDVVTVICTARQVEEYLSRTYRHSDEANVAARNAALSAAASEATQLGELTDLHAVVEDAPIVKFVNLILRQALNERASDVHIEPTSDDLQVRFRIDGVLHEVTSAPKAIQGGVTSRLKIMADLDIAEHRVPQDGRLSLNAGGREIDLRVATLPTVHGEKVVLRVLDKSTAPLDLARLGFLPEVLSRYEECYRKPSGTILVTGPTGSGKSTTLYATLNKLNSSERNLITVEDPVEYQLRGVNQVQVNPRAGLSFASALRSILRSDPDVVLVGEIRDRETATIAVEAALTGHLVLSTLHTNDAASTPLRLVEMGVEPFLVCSALDCVLAQRLARLLCDVCSDPYEPTSQELVAARWVEADTPESGDVQFRRAVGCQACSGTGYRGRLAIQEVLPVTEEVERAILARASTEDIKRLAIFEGMTTMHRDGLRKAAMGLTSLEEILRVVV
ncbi:MAG: ATPase, T2SS/T4P/T4SS family [Actinomycetota bacterium]|nr:ATPase, T2SS/T4P/T4SS family [Actinomycetota bacterium]